MQTRFFQKLRSLTDDAADHLCNVDYQEEMAFAAVVGRAEHERIVATSSYYLDPRERVAEVAYLVDPEWQGAGLATALHARTTEYARSHGVRGFSADVLMSNRRDAQGLPREARARPRHRARRRRVRGPDDVHGRGRGRAGVGVSAELFDGLDDAARAGDRSDCLYVVESGLPPGRPSR